MEGANFGHTVATGMPRSSYGCSLANTNETQRTPEFERVLDHMRVLGESFASLHNRAEAVCIRLLGHEAQPPGQETASKTLDPGDVVSRQRAACRQLESIASGLNAAITRLETL